MLNLPLLLLLLKLGSTAKFLQIALTRWTKKREIVID